MMRRDGEGGGRDKGLVQGPFEALYVHGETSELRFPLARVPNGALRPVE